jgi:hypothetical protein
VHQLKFCDHKEPTFDRYITTDQKQAETTPLRWQQNYKK